MEEKNNNVFETWKEAEEGFWGVIFLTSLIVILGLAFVVGLLVS